MAECSGGKASGVTFGVGYRQDSASMLLPDEGDLLEEEEDEDPNNDSYDNLNDETFGRADCLELADDFDEPPPVGEFEMDTYAQQSAAFETSPKPMSSNAEIYQRQQSQQEWVNLMMQHLLDEDDDTAPGKWSHGAPPASELPLPGFFDFTGGVSPNKQQSFPEAEPRLSAGGGDVSFGYQMFNPMHSHFLEMGTLDSIWGPRVDPTSSGLFGAEPDRKVQNGNSPSLFNDASAFNSAHIDTSGTRDALTALDERLAWTAGQPPQQQQNTAQAQQSPTQQRHSDVEQKKPVDPIMALLHNMHMQANHQSAPAHQPSPTTHNQVDNSLAPRLKMHTLAEIEEEMRRTQQQHPRTQQPPPLTLEELERRMHAEQQAPAHRRSPISPQHSPPLVRGPPPGIPPPPHHVGGHPNAGGMMPPVGPTVPPGAVFIKVRLGTGPPMGAGGGMARPPPPWMLPQYRAAIMAHIQAGKPLPQGFPPPAFFLRGAGPPPPPPPFGNAGPPPPPNQRPGFPGGNNVGRLNLVHPQQRPPPPRPPCSAAEWRMMNGNSKVAFFQQQQQRYWHQMQKKQLMQQQFRQQQQYWQQQQQGGAEQPQQRRSDIFVDPLFDGRNGLISRREREWLVKIQQMQCQGTGNPYEDDYYYHMYRQRQLGRRAERLKIGREPGIGDTGETPTTPYNYKPPTFEGSLGRPSLSSAAQPRQLLDLHSHYAADGERRDDQDG